MRGKNILVFLFCLALSIQVLAVDTDSDGMADDYEVSQGYDPNTYTKIVYVDDNQVDDSGDGLSLVNAKKTISAAISISQDADKENVILVAAGTYAGANNKNIDFGGFDVKLRSIAGAATTIIDLENDGRFLSLYNNSYGCLLGGFTIINGNAQVGAVINADTAKIVIENCIFKSNIAARIFDNSIKAGFDGGGVLYAHKGDYTLKNCKFIRNNSGFYSGAIYAHGIEVNMEIINCDFIENNAIYGGAIVFGSETTAEIKNCRFIRNSGSAICGGGDTDVTMKNCLAINNCSKSSGCFYRMEGNAILNLVNCTVFDNSENSPAGIYVLGTLNIKNCILKTNIAGQVPETVNNSYSLTDMSSRGSGNSTADPRITPMGYLLSDSPCINAGDNNGAPNDDLEGVQRPTGNYVDVGCYEFADFDGNGIPDNYENNGSVNPSEDNDNDTLSNLQEYQNSTSIYVVDTDNDGLDDALEINIYGTDPLNNDSDNDGLTDGQEVNSTSCTDPQNADSDGDGVSDGLEIAAGMDPNDSADVNIDSDNDGIPDGAEVKAGLNRNVNDADEDIDGDNLTNLEEYNLGYTMNWYTRIVYVDASRPDDSGDGLSWESAKKTLKAAVEKSRQSVYESVIMVEDGIYTGVNNRNLNFGTFDIILKSKSGANSTIIDLEDSSRFFTGDVYLSLASRIDGFTIINGNCTEKGSVIYLYKSGLTVENCIFRNNHCDNNGGAIYSALSNILLKNCVFDNNSVSSGNGGVIYVYCSKSEIYDCKFINNSSSEYGGAIYFVSASGSVITNCDMINNKASSGGALAFSNYSEDIEISNCRFYNNTVTYRGGTITAMFYSNVTMTNCFANGNKAENNYAFCFMQAGSVLNLINSTVINCESQNAYDINVDGTLNVKNSIFRVNVSGIPTSVVNCCTLTEMSAYGIGNFIADPQLNPKGYLLSTSPCIDAGLTTGAPAEDMDGVSRPAGSGIDIGCYEFLDTDGDGIPDSIETAAGLDPNDASDMNGDFDGDGLSNINEYVYATSIVLADTDGDGLTDNIEITNGLDPNNTSDATADPDDDGLTNAQEISYNTNMNAADSDGDGLDDGTEIGVGFDPNDSADAAADTDLDGMINRDEILLGRNYLKGFVDDTNNTELQLQIFTSLY